MTGVRSELPDVHGNCPNRRDPGSGLHSFLPDRFPRQLHQWTRSGRQRSIEGVCLTATEILSPDRVSFDAILQSLAVTTLSALEVGAIVNAERAAKDGAEIGGHPLSAYIYFSTEIEVVSEIGGNKALRVHIPEAFRRYIFPKGYIAG